ncbi:hypothetical protein EJB05_49588, partial [Eragrostis curvula]
MDPSEEELAQAAKYFETAVISVDESNKAFIERSIELSREFRKYSNDCARRVRKLNATLPKDQEFFPINIGPRDPKLLIMALEPVYKEFQMDDTSPFDCTYVYLENFLLTATWGCKHFTNPEPRENYAASTMLQVFSLRFAGYFLDDQQPLPVYGFVAVRDDCEPLRNYIVNRGREDAVKLSPDSRLLPLMSPVRGMSVWIKALVEISLKVKNNSSTCDENDDVIVDICIDFRWDQIIRGKKLKSRIECPLGTLEMEYMFIKHGIEAVVEFDIPMELAGDHIVIIARARGFKHELTLYDAVVHAETARVSSVVVASLGGSLYFGYVAVGARASGCTRVEVANHGTYKGHVVVALGTSPKTCLIPFTVTFSTMGYYNNGS